LLSKGAESNQQSPHLQVLEFVIDSLVVRIESLATTSTISDFVIVLDLLLNLKGGERVVGEIILRSVSRADRSKSTPHSY
jgi:hypothetical protein